MNLVFFLQPTQDRDRILDRRFGHQHCLETPRQRRIFFNMLAVFVERCRTNTVQLATRERRLQHVRCIHRPFRGAGTDKRMQLIDKQNDLTRFGFDLLQNRFQALFEFTAELRARDQCAEVKRHQPLAAQAFRHVAIDDALSQTFNNSGLSDTRLTDQDGIVLWSGATDT